MKIGWLVVMVVALVGCGPSMEGGGEGSGADYENFFKCAYNFCRDRAHECKHDDMGYCYPEGADEQCAEAHGSGDYQMLKSWCEDYDEHGTTSAEECIQWAKKCQRFSE